MRELYGRVNKQLYEQRKNNVQQSSSQHLNPYQSPAVKRTYDTNRLAQSTTHLSDVLPFQTINSVGGDITISEINTSIFGHKNTNTDTLGKKKN